MVHYFHHLCQSEQMHLIMKMKGLIPLFLACAGLLACQSPTSIQWIEGEVSEGNRLATNSQVIQNPPKGDWLEHIQKSCQK